MEPELELGIIWQDEDMVNLWASANNGRFCGETRIYVDRESFQTFVDALKGFPKTHNDKLEFSVGSPGDYSYLSLRFYCYKITGQVAIRIRIESNELGDTRPEEKSFAEFAMLTEPALIDLFHPQLVKVAIDEAGTAKLRGTQRS